MYACTGHSTTYVWWSCTACQPKHDPYRNMNINFKQWSQKYQNMPYNRASAVKSADRLIHCECKACLPVLEEAFLPRREEIVKIARRSSRPLRVCSDNRVTRKICSTLTAQGVGTIVRRGPKTEAQPICKRTICFAVEQHQTHLGVRTRTRADRAGRG